MKVSFYSSFLGIIVYSNGIISSMLITDNLHLNNIIYSGTFFIKKDVLKKGYSMPLKFFGLFSLVSNVELVPFKGSTLIRAAGSSGLVVNNKEKKVNLKLRSGWFVRLNSECLASLGIGSNSQHRFFRYKKAGHKRGLGVRPTVRGVAMNPCDHPHGGGEGRKSPKASARSPWGWLTKGTPSKLKKIHIVNKKKYKGIR